MDDLRFILSFAAKRKKDFIIAFACVAIETSFELLIPYVMARLLDEGVSQGNLHSIYFYGIIISLCAFMSLINGLLYSRFAARAAAGFGDEIRKAQFRSIEQYSFSNLDHFEPSSLITRVINDSNVVQNTMASGIRPLIRAPLMLIMGIGFSVMINFRLALIFIVMIPILGILLYLIMRYVAPRFVALQKSLDRLNEKIQENLVAIRTVKAFVRKPYEAEKFDAANNDYVTIVRSTFKVASLNAPVFQLIMYLGTVLFMYFGGNMIIGGIILPGALTGLLSYVMQTFNSLMMISNIFLMLSRSLASIYRINQVLREKPDIADGTGEGKLTKGDIEFSHVFFRYSASARENVLSDISLRIEAGQTLGILGPTGSAKSTLVQLIPRLYDVTSGQIRIDGQDIKSFRLKELRSAIGMVLQKNMLFSGTLIDNLKFSGKDFTDEELSQALDISCVSEFLDKLPAGLDSEMGIEGRNVSGGQRQRICLARALLKKPKVLILDDTTSAVDTMTERKIRTGLSSIRNMTKIIISQRILSVMEADRILILKDGKINDIGTHEELLSRNRIYMDLYNSQLKGVVEHA